MGWARQFVADARVGRQVLAAGGSVTSTVTGAGSTTTVGGAGAVQVPVWVYYVGGGLLLFMLIGFLFRLLKK